MADPIQPAGADLARRMMPSLQISARGMSAQQTFLDVIARNVANAETTREADGTPYDRQVAAARPGAGPGDLEVEITSDPTPGRRVYDPGHPDADLDGFVQYPNVDVQSELVDLMVVRRMYEANASVFQAAKRMLKKALEI